MLLFHLLFCTCHINFEKLNFVISQLINYCCHHLEFNKLFSCLSTFNCKLSNFKSTKDSMDNSFFSFQGTVDLHNLPLKKTALKGLELPLEVKSGFIGHLQLSIPLRRPKSEPWIVHINKLYLVAGPLQHSEV